MNPRRARNLTEALNLISYLANHPGVRVETVCEVFRLSRGALLRRLNEILMFGVPPYGPMDYVTAWVEQGRVTLVNADFLRKPLRLTLSEAVSLRMMLDDFIRQSPGLFGETAARLSAKLASLVGSRAREGGRYSRGAAKFEAIERALNGSLLLLISYYNRAEDSFTERTVEPRALVDIDGLWYLVAYCRMRGGERSFRIDRIRTAEVLQERFERPEDFDASRFRREEMFFPSGRETRVRIRFGPESARFARERFSKVCVQGPADGAVVCEVPAADIAWVSDLVVEFAPDAAVEGPLEVREAVKKRLAAVLRLYGS